MNNVSLHNQIAEQTNEQPVPEKKLVYAGYYRRQRPTLVTVKPADTAADRFKNTIRQIAEDMEKRGF